MLLNWAADSGIVQVGVNDAGVLDCEFVRNWLVELMIQGVGGWLVIFLCTMGAGKYVCVVPGRRALVGD